MANLPRAHLFLGIGHGFYGLGALVAPILATIIANTTEDFRHWYYFYYCTLGLAVINSSLIAFAFRESLWAPLRHKITGKSNGEAVIRADKKNTKEANADFRQIIRRKEVWILAAYFFLYVGAEVAAGGWVVEFMIEVRGGHPSQVGYVAFNIR